MRRIKDTQAFLRFLDTFKISVKDILEGRAPDAIERFLRFRDEDTLLNFFARAWSEFGPQMDIGEFELVNSGEYCFSLTNGGHFALRIQTARDLIEETCENCGNMTFGDENACTEGGDCWVELKTHKNYQNNWVPIPEDIDDYD